MDYSTFANNIKKRDLSITKLDFSYNQGDSRCWTALVDQGNANILVSFNVNRTDLGSQVFDVFYSGNIITDVPVEEIYTTIEDATSTRQSNSEPQPSIINYV